MKIFRARAPKEPLFFSGGGVGWGNSAPSSKPPEAPERRACFTLKITLYHPLACMALYHYIAHITLCHDIATNTLHGRQTREEQTNPKP